MDRFELQEKIRKDKEEARKYPKLGFSKGFLTTEEPGRCGLSSLIILSSVVVVWFGLGVGLIAVIWISGVFIAFAFADTQRESDKV